MYVDNNLLTKDKSFNDNDFKLFDKGQTADIYYDGRDYRVVEIASGDLAVDIERVTGHKANVINKSNGLNKQMVLIGTLGKNDLIDSLIEKGSIDVSEIEGQWESFIITVVNTPFSGVEQALIIVGSDRRGTAFGVYELSEQIGVSPWYWWADVPVKKHDQLIIKAGFYNYGSPSVKYRGIFINDEDWGIKPWAAETLEPENGDIGPRTYAKIFELLLRLKANYIWPAMHECTRAFNTFPENKVIADNYAIVVGSSHCEPMLRNNVGEWDKEIFGRYTDKEWTNKHKTWNYQENPDVIYKYWEDRIKDVGQYENTYTIGMRGIHDGGMPGPDNLADKAELLEKVISDQREILAEYVNTEISEVPQLFCPYKEVLDIYKHGLNVPEEATLLWSNDNFGYITHLSNSEEQKRSGGAGIYYHISYWGRPHDYLWLCTTPPVLIWEEMKKAYEYHARNIWVLNVGDLKPGEFLTEFFLKLAWKISSIDDKNIDDYICNWIAKNFGEKYQTEIIRVIKGFYRLTYIRKPEHMGWNSVYPNTSMSDPEFSLFNYGDEAEKYIDRYSSITQKAEEIYRNIASELKDSFYQLVLYPVKSSSLMVKKILYAYRSRVYAEQGRISANKYADLAEKSYQQIIIETEYYNNYLSQGKWNKVMSMNPRSLPVFEMPEVNRVQSFSAGDYGIVLEGCEELLEGDSNNKLPIFNRFIRGSYFIDIFNKDSEIISWEAEVSGGWIKLSQNSGDLVDEDRILVSIDWDKAPIGDSVEGNINISVLGRENTINIEILNPEYIQISENNQFIQTNGYISIEAENYSQIVDSEKAKWDLVKGLGRTGTGSMAVFPITAPSIEVDKLNEKAPCLEYNLLVLNPGEVEVMVYCIPTHSINEEIALRYAIALDDAEPKIVELHSYNNEQDSIWQRNVLRSANISNTSHFIKEDGRHTLKIWMVDPGVIIDKIVMDFGGVKPSYLGPSETIMMK